MAPDGARSARPLRVAICLAHFHPVVGGAERQMFQLARRWASWGHEPVVFTRHAPGLPRREIVDGVEILRVIRTAPLGPLFGLSYIASLAWQLVLRAGRFDVVLDGQIPWEAVSTGLVCPLLGKQAMVMPASTGPVGDVHQIAAAKGSWLLRRLVLNNHRFLALSAEASAELQDLGCKISSIRRLGNGVDLRRYAPAAQESPERARTVLWVARLVGAKNPYVLLRAWRQLNDKGKYRLLLAGDGPLAAELQQFAQAQRLRNVHFLGAVEDVPSLHRQASVFCLPSFGEGCSNALLEAMAGGLCPVVSRVAGNIDVVRDGVNGLMFDDDDEVQLASQLARALEDAPLRRRLSARARAYVVANHDLDRVAGELLDEFETLAASRATWRAVKS
ncbi:MAG TPA: glycosyltransferase family 4 protein, partial [Pirellulales bacterium]|nr:glycosyltransferase family 4 protein [Pirellulales bacterium]